MKWRICQCEINGLRRPENGPIRIKKTDMVDKDVLKAQLSGPSAGTVHTVRIRGKFFYVGPKKEIREVPADTLTDALHAAVWIRNEEIKMKRKLPNKKRPMPHVSVNKIGKKKA